MPTNVRRGLAVLTATVMVSTGCGSRTAEPPSAAGLDAAGLDHAVTAAMKTAKVPGALVGVWSPDGDYVTAFGVADTATGRPMATDFHSRIGSVTKTFTATAVLQLVEAGKVGLDDPIGDYLDGVPDGRTITIRQLAAMRGGIAGLS